MDNIIIKNAPILTTDMKIAYSPKIPSGLKIFIDPHLCVGCGLCAEVCPFGLPIRDMVGKYYINRADLCVECSACQRNCPINAIFMQEQKGCGCLWNVVSEKKGKKSNCC